MFCGMGKGRGRNQGRVLYSTNQKKNDEGMKGEQSKIEWEKDMNEEIGWFIIST